MMKKIIWMMILSLFCVSCFRYYKAARIESYKLRVPENGVVRLTQYAFQFTGNPRHLNLHIRTFFDLTAGQPLYEFETDRLLAGQNLKIYISSNQDEDRVVGVGNIIRGMKEQKHHKFDREIEKKSAHHQIWFIDSDKIKYLYIQVMDENGNDALAKPGLQQQELIAQFNALRLILNR